MFNRFLIGLWILMVFAGVLVMARYSQTKAPVAHAAQSFPANLTWKKQPGKSTLIVFLHPQCPCSKATVGEIESILPQLRGHLEIIFSFYSPSDKEPGWAKSSLYEQSLRLPGVELQLDPDGETSERFDARASGESFLYDENGELVFHGGLTPGRGHQGDNPGQQALIDWVNRHHVAVRETPVFGCQIRKTKIERVGDAG